MSDPFEKFNDKGDDIMPQNDNEPLEFYDVTSVVKDWLENAQGVSEERKEELIEKFTLVMKEKNKE
jgi:hypothetical protein